MRKKIISLNPKNELTPPVSFPELEAYYQAPEILAPRSPKELVGSTCAKGNETLELPNGEFDGIGDA